MSNRDKTLIIVVLLVAVVLLPYFFFIKDEKDLINNTINETALLQERYDYLLSLEEDRDYYKEQTVILNDDTDAIIETFPAGISDDNYAMFLLLAEYALADVEIDEDGNTYVTPGLRIDTGTFTNMSEILLENEDYSTGYIGLKGETELTFTFYDYESFLYIMNYINEYKDPYTYPTISLSYVPEFGHIKGTAAFEQYAIIGGPVDEDGNPLRVYEKLDIIPNIDDNDMRGNEDYGVFGPTEQQENDDIFEAVTGERPDHDGADEDDDDDDDDEEEDD